MVGLKELTKQTCQVQMVLLHVQTQMMHLTGLLPFFKPFDSL
jgi:hypothetical protein